MRERRQFSDDFKAKIALEALRGNHALSQIAARNIISIRKTRYARITPILTAPMPRRFPSDIFENFRGL